MKIIILIIMIIVIIIDCVLTSYLFSFSMLSACKTEEEVYKLSRDGQAMLQAVEDSPKPVVAAIMGTCMGGGLEVSKALKF